MATRADQILEEARRRGIGPETSPVADAGGANALKLLGRGIAAADVSIQTPIGDVDLSRVAANAVDALERLENLDTGGFIGNVGKQAFRQFLNNALGIVKGTGEALAIGGAAIQAGTETLVGGDDDTSFSERFADAREEQRKLFPASALLALPRLTIEGILAAGKVVTQSAGAPPGSLFGAPTAGNPLARPDFAGQFSQNLLEEQAKAAAGAAAPGGTTGRVVGDVATLLAGRAPLARARAPAARSRRLQVEEKLTTGLPPSVKRKTQDILTGRILPALRGAGVGIGRGLKRAGEASIEGATLALLNDQDPFASAALAAGAQAGGSLGLFLSEAPVKRLLPTVGMAAMITLMFQAVTPGQRNVFEALDFATDKAIAAFALGLMGTIGGAGRLRGPAAETFPALLDAITVVPRGAVQSRLRELVDAEKSSNQTPFLVMQKLARNPGFFNDNQLRSLGRALQSEKPGAFSKEVDRLTDASDDFRKKLDDL